MGIGYAPAALPVRVFDISVIRQSQHHQRHLWLRTACAKLDTLEGVSTVLTCADREWCGADMPQTDKLLISQLQQHTATEHQPPYPLDNIKGSQASRFCARNIDNAWAVLTPRTSNALCSWAIFACAHSFSSNLDRSNGCCPTSPFLYNYHTNHLPIHSLTPSHFTHTLTLPLIYSLFHFCSMYRPLIFRLHSIPCSIRLHSNPASKILLH